MTIDSWKGLYQPCSALDKTSFAYESTVKRWPQIITSIIDNLANLNGQMISNEPNQIKKLSESKEIIRDLSGLIYEMRHDRVLIPIEDIGFPNDAKLYNSELERDKENGHGTWFSSSWLYAECYMYRRIRTLFASSTQWKTFDPFLTPKLSAFRSSSTSIMSLATAFSTLLSRGIQTNLEDVKIDFKLMLDTCLWGNATDLSLLTSLTHEQLQALQSTERGANFVLKDDFEKVWKVLTSSEKGRIDFVLDNSGFELYTDLVLADWFLSLSPFCTEIMFHPKVIPWFVSDVLPHDFEALFSSLLDPNFFPSNSGATEEEKLALKVMVERWQSYVRDGKFKLSVDWDMKLGDKGSEMADFWSAPNAFGDLPELAPELLKDLKKSNLVIFKDYDACWPTTTPFEDTLGPLKGEINLLSLRTCKADVCVGLIEGKAEELDVIDLTWRISGKYAVVSYCGKDL